MNENEMKEEKTLKGRNVLLAVIAIATLLIAIVGATYAFFTVAITGNDSATSVIVKTATLGIVFNDGDAITLDNLMPGDARLSTSFPKEFSVTNTSSVNMTYSVVWMDVVNTFPVGHDLYYYVTGSSSLGGGGSTPGSVAAGTLVPNAGTSTMMATITIYPNETHTYNLYLVFPNTSSNQDAQQGKTFAGKLQVTDASA